MNNITFFLVWVSLLLSAATFAQKCNCVENFNWMVNTFEENDAGFQYVLDKKGKDYYEDFKKRLTDRFLNGMTFKDIEVVLLDVIESSSNSYGGTFIDLCNEYSGKLKIWK